MAEPCRGHVVITGASGGIGRSLCHRFGQAGYWVTALDRSQPPAGLSANRFLEFDIRRLGQPRAEQELAAAIAAGQSPPVSCLVHNAAVQILGEALSITPEQWHETLSVNLLAAYYLIRLFAPSLAATRGSVIHMSSIHCNLTKSGFLAYATSKSALDGLTRSLAVELGSRFRINAIAPAATDTPMLRAGFALRPDALDQLAQMHPLGRIASADDVARVACFLASPDANFINGATIAVDGGISSCLSDPD